MAASSGKALTVVGPVLAAAILRQLHAVTTTGQAWDLNIATHGTHNKAMPVAA